jgi:hypothetical protein
LKGLPAGTERLEALLGQVPALENTDHRLDHSPDAAPAVVGTPKQLIAAPEWQASF